MSDKIYFGGINGITGEYARPPLDYSEIVDIAKAEIIDWDAIADFKRINEEHLGLPVEVEDYPNDLDKVGWGIIFHQDEDVAVRQALQPLIEHRMQQVETPGSKLKIRVLEVKPEDEDWNGWLVRNKVRDRIEIEPEKVPYYLLLVGSPEKIPFVFGYQLDMVYAVGRIHFDTVDEYKQYAASVVEYETALVVPNAKEVTFFAPRHHSDPPVERLFDQLMMPLANGIDTQGGIAERFGFRKRTIFKEEATWLALETTLAPGGTAKPPAFLFTATHGTEFHNGSAEQLEAQGALVCQDWLGLNSITKDHYFCGKDVPSDARIHGLIAFLYACYGGGTPKHDRFFHLKDAPPDQIALHDFLAALPKSLLAHPKGGALACVAHIDRAWGFSLNTLMTADISGQIKSFENTIGRILKGERLGHAVRNFSERYTAVSAELADIVEDIKSGLVDVPNEKIVKLWIERNDAEGYVIIGDPAVRLRIEDLM